MPKPTLGYWDIRGFAQHIKAVLFYLGVDYELKTFNDNPNGGRDEWFNKAKFSLGLDFPNVPYWIDGELKITEKMAILKHICRKYGPQLLPKIGDENANAKAEMLEGFLTDCLMHLVNYAYVATDEIKSNFPDSTKTKFEQLSKFLGDKHFLLGSEVSYVDFYMYEILYHYKAVESVTGLKLLLNSFPTLEKYFKHFEAIPKMQEFMKTPGYISKPCYSTMAKLRF